MTPLHQLGDGIRELLLLVPLGVVRALFVMIPAALIVWVLCLPKAQTRPPEGKAGWSGNLKFWAVVTLLIQMAIYAWL